MAQDIVSPLHQTTAGTCVLQAVRCVPECALYGIWKWLEAVDEPLVPAFFERQVTQILSLLGGQLNVVPIQCFAAQTEMYVAADCPHGYVALQTAEMVDKSIDVGEIRHSMIKVVMSLLCIVGSEVSDVAGVP